jgi:hypothetical protein
MGALTGKLYVRRLRLNAGGYDANGAYFGGGAPPLFWIASADLKIDYVVRAANRAAAKLTALTDYPSALFFR